MRKFNLRFFLALLLGVTVLAGSVSGVHFFQRQRIAAALLWQAARAEEQEQFGDMARYLTRYLEFNPHDLEAKERLGQTLVGEHFAAQPRRQRRGLYLLDSVLTQQPDRPDLRLVVVRAALELQEPKLARDHLELLWKDSTAVDGTATEKDRGELEGLWGALLEAESKPDVAVDWYRKAIVHNPEVCTSHIRLAYLMRRSNPGSAEKTAANLSEADRVIDQMVAANPESASAHLARWRYRRDFDGLKENGALSDARLALAAKDVAAAARLTPKALDVLLATADLERLRAQLAASDGDLEKAERVRAIEEHRERAYRNLHEGLERLASRGARPDDDAQRFQFLWHLANLLLDDPRPVDSAEGKEAAAEAEQVLAKLAKTRGAPAAVEYLQARWRQRQRQWAEAALHFEQARPLLNDQPDLVAQIDYFLGQCYEQLDEPGQMYAAYARLAAFDPNSTTARLGMASAQWAMGRLDEAAHHYRQVMERGGASPRLWLDVVRLEIRRQAQRDQKDWKDAEAALVEAAKALPDSLEPILLRAEVLVARGQLAEAEDLLTRTRMEKPGRSEIWTGLALLTEKTKDQARGLAILAKAEKELGDVVELRLARARMLSAQGKAAIDKILSLAEGADRFKLEDRARLLGGLAEALFRTGATAAGRKLVKELAGLPVRQSDLRLQMLLFDLAQRDGDDAAMDEALQGLAKAEGGDGAMTRYGMAMREIGRARREADNRKSAREAAGVHLDRAASLRPSWPPVTLARADIAELSGNPEQAIGHLKQAIDQGESNPRVIQRLVEALYQRQRFAEADQELRRLRQALLMNSELGRLAAGIALRKGDQTRALELARDAVARDSSDYREQIRPGQMLAAVHAPTEAEEKLRRAVALAPDKPESWVALVQFLAGQKQEQAARAEVAQVAARLTSEKATLALAQCHEAVGDWAEANRCYASALKNRGDEVSVVRTVVAYYLRVGRNEQATPLLERLVAGKLKASASDLDWARGSLAVLLAVGGDAHRFGRALALVGLQLDDKGHLVHDKENGDDSTEILCARARVLATQSQRQYRERAVELLESLGRRQALTADDRFILALLYDVDGASAKSRDLLRDLVLTQVQSPLYIAQYVLTLLQQRDLEQAAVWTARLEKLERQQDKPVNTYGTVELRARVLEARGEGDQAVALIRAHVQRPGAVANELLLVVASLGRQKRYAEALALCASTWDRCSPEAVGGISVTLLRAMPSSEAQCREVETRLRRAIDTAARNGQPAPPMLLMQLADLCDQLGRYGDAEELYRQVLKVDPAQFAALNNLAWLIVQRTGNGTEALPMIEAAVNSTGRRADLLDTRGLVYLALGKTEQAVADLKESSAEVPTPTRLFHLARALHEASDRDGAVKALHQARELGLQPAKLHPVEQQTCRKLLAELSVQ